MTFRFYVHHKIYKSDYLYRYKVFGKTSRALFLLYNEKIMHKPKFIILKFFSTFNGSYKCKFEMLLGLIDWFSSYLPNRCFFVDYCITNNCRNSEQFLNYWRWWNPRAKRSNAFNYWSVLHKHDSPVYIKIIYREYYRSAIKYTVSTSAYK